jgi:hypothetical protein
MEDLVRENKTALIFCLFEDGKGVILCGTKILYVNWCMRD